jgi:hypothetical protein
MAAQVRCAVNIRSRKISNIWSYEQGKKYPLHLCVSVARVVYLEFCVRGEEPTYLGYAERSELMAGFVFQQRFQFFSELGVVVVAFEAFGTDAKGTDEDRAIGVG